MYNPSTGRYEPGWRPESDEMPVDPGLVIESGEGRWQDVVNTKTGEHSVKTHKLKVVHQWCKDGDHFYVETNPTTHDIQCTKCGNETRYVLGICKLVDGKLIKMTPET